jgi:hypothetical protein
MRRECSSKKWRKAVGGRRRARKRRDAGLKLFSFKGYHTSINTHGTTVKPFESGLVSHPVCGMYWSETRLEAPKLVQPPKCTAMRRVSKCLTLRDLAHFDVVIVIDCAQSPFLLHEEPTESLALPPVVVQRMLPQWGHTKEVWEWEKTVLMLPHWLHFTSRKNELGD